MEKSIHTLLFTSAVSDNEHRLLGFSAEAPKNQVEFDDAAKKLKEGIDDPNKNTVELYAEQHVLALSTFFRDPANAAKVAEIIQLLDRRVKAEARPAEIKKLTAAGTPEWDKMEKAIKENTADKAVQLVSAKKLLNETFGELIGLSVPPAPINGDAQIEALSQNIVRIKALDPSLIGADLTVDNKVNKDDPKVQDADTKLENIKAGHITFMDISGRFSVALKEMADAVATGRAPTIEGAKAKLNPIVKRRTEALTGVVLDVSTGTRPYNAELQIQEVMKQKQEIETEAKKAKGEKVPNVSAAPTSGPAPTLDPLKDEEQAAIRALKAAIKSGKKEDQDKELKIWNDQTLSGPDAEKKAAQINAELVKDPNKITDKEVKATNGKLTVGDKAPAGAINSKEKEDLNYFIEKIKEFLIWLTNFERHNKIANGDLNAMRSKSAELGLQINKIKANPNFATDPALKKEYADLTAEKDALDAQIKEVEAKNKTAVADINAKVNQANQVNHGTCAFAANCDKAGQMYLIGAQPQIAYIAQQCGGQPFVAQAINGVPTYATYINKGNVSIGGSNYGNINTGSNNKNMQTQGNNDVGNSRVSRGSYGWPRNVDARYSLPGYRGTFYG